MNLTEFANARRAGMNTTLGLEFTDVSLERVCAVVPVAPHLLQPYGIVHGGVYAAFSETLCSVGAAMHAMQQGLSAVGLDNHTSFLRAVREGTLHGEALPIHCGRRTHVWEARILDDAGKLAATARVRMMVLDQGASLAGETVKLQDPAMQAEADKHRDTAEG